MNNQKKLVLDIIQELVAMKDSPSSIAHKEEIKKHKIFWFADIMDILRERNIKPFRVMPIINSLKKEGVIKEYSGDKFSYFDYQYQLLI